MTSAASRHRSSLLLLLVALLLFTAAASSSSCLAKNSSSSSSSRTTASITLPTVSRSDSAGNGNLSRTASFSTTCGTATATDKTDTGTPDPLPTRSHSTTQVRQRRATSNLAAARSLVAGLGLAGLVIGGAGSVAPLAVRNVLLTRSGDCAAGTVSDLGPEIHPTRIWFGYDSYGQWRGLVVGWGLVVVVCIVIAVLVAQAFANVSKREFEDAVLTLQIPRVLGTLFFICWAPVQTGFAAVVAYAESTVIQNALMYCVYCILASPVLLQCWACVEAARKLHLVPNDPDEDVTSKQQQLLANSANALRIDHRAARKLEAQKSRAAAIWLWLQNKHAYWCRSAWQHGMDWDGGEKHVQRFGIFFEHTALPYSAIWEVGGTVASTALTGLMEQPGSLRLCQAAALGSLAVQMISLSFLIWKRPILSRIDNVVVFTFSVCNVLTAGLVLVKLYNMSKVNDNSSNNNNKPQQAASEDDDIAKLPASIDDIIGITSFLVTVVSLVVAALTFLFACAFVAFQVVKIRESRKRRRRLEKALKLRQLMQKQKKKKRATNLNDLGNAADADADGEQQQDEEDELLAELLQDVAWHNQQRRAEEKKREAAERRRKRRLAGQVDTDDDDDDDDYDAGAVNGQNGTNAADLSKHLRDGFDLEAIFDLSTPEERVALSRLQSMIPHMSPKQRRALRLIQHYDPTQLARFADMLQQFGDGTKLLRFCVNQYGPEPDLTSQQAPEREQQQQQKKLQAASNKATSPKQRAEQLLKQQDPTAAATGVPSTLLYKFHGRESLLVAALERRAALLAAQAHNRPSSSAQHALESDESDDDDDEIELREMHSPRQQQQDSDTQPQATSSSNEAAAAATLSSLSSRLVAHQDDVAAVNNDDMFTLQGRHHQRQLAEQQQVENLHREFHCNAAAVVDVEDFDPEQLFKRV